MAKRKLSRIASNPRDVVVSKVMCVSGVRLKTPAPIQIEEKGEQGEFAVVSSRTPWLNEVLCGVKSDSKMHDKIATMLLDMRASKHNTDSEAARDQEREQRRQHRKDMDLSDGDETDSGDDEEPEQPVKRGRGCAHLFQVKEVAVKGYMVKYAYSNRRYFIKADAENLVSFIKAALSYTDTEAQARKNDRQTSAQSGFSPPGATKKVVRYMSARRTYVIEYQDASGRTVTSTTNLRPAEHHASGRVLTEEEFAQEMHRRRRAAQELWNTLDCSDRDRIPVDS